MRLSASAGRAVFVGIAVVWALSLALPAVQIAGGPSLSGADVLARGWQGARAGVLAWYSNPLFLLAVLLGSLGWSRAAGVLSGLGAVLALTTFSAARTAAGSGMSLSFDAGFYIWLAAQFAVLAWSWASVALRNSREDLGGP